MKKMLLAVIAVLALGLGGYLLLAGSSSPAPGPSGGSAIAPTSTTVPGSLPVPTTTPTTSPFVTSFSQACDAALAPARGVLAKLAAGQKLSSAEAKTLAASVDQASKTCSSSEFLTFQANELQRYITK